MISYRPPTGAADSIIEGQESIGGNLRNVVVPSREDAGPSHSVGLGPESNRSFVGRNEPPVGAPSLASTAGGLRDDPISLKGRILRSFARGDLGRLDNDLMIVPLRFTDREMEAEYATHVHLHYRARLRFAAVVLLLINTAMWLTVGLGFQDAMSFFIPPELEYAFHVHEIVACLVAIIIFCVPNIPFLREVPEVVFYWLLAAMFTSHFVLMNFSLRSMPTNLDLRGASMWDFRLVHDLKLGFIKMKFWSDATAFTMYCGCLIGINLFCQSRTKYSWTVNVYAFLMVNIPLWMQYRKFNPIFDYRTTMALLQILTASIVLMSFYARCHRELQERVEFYQLVRANQKLQKVRAQLKQKRQFCSTGIEELVNMLQTPAARD